MSIKVTTLSIPDILVIEPIVFRDERGFFFESFNQSDFEKTTNLAPIFIQENHSRSIKGTLRGLHYQLPPKAQGKLIRVVYGKVFDVVVDIRKSSPSFGKSITQILSAENKKQLWVPEGFAHGYLGISDRSELLYKTTNYYSPELERIIKYNDPSLIISWPDSLSINCSRKDKGGLYLKESEVFL